MLAPSLWRGFFVRGSNGEMRDFLGLVSLLLSGIAAMLAVQWMFIAIGSYDPVRDDGISPQMLPFLWIYQAVLFLAGLIAIPFAWRYLKATNVTSYSK